MLHQRGRMAELPDCNTGDLVSVPGSVTDFLCGLLQDLQ